MEEEETDKSQKANNDFQTSTDINESWRRLPGELLMVQTHSTLEGYGSG